MGHVQRVEYIAAITVEEYTGDVTTVKFLYTVYPQKRKNICCLYGVVLPAIHVFFHLLFHPLTQWCAAQSTQNPFPPSL